MRDASGQWLNVEACVPKAHGILVLYKLCEGSITTPPCSYAMCTRGGSTGLSLPVNMSVDFHYLVTNTFCFVTVSFFL